MVYSTPPAAKMNAYSASRKVWMIRRLWFDVLKCGSCKQCSARIMQLPCWPGTGQWSFHGYNEALTILLIILMMLWNHRLGLKDNEAYKQNVNAITCAVTADAAMSSKRCWSACWMNVGITRCTDKKRIGASKWKKEQMINKMGSCTNWVHDKQYPCAGFRQFTACNLWAPAVSIRIQKSQAVRFNREYIFHITQPEHRFLCQIQKQGQTWHSKAMPYRAELTLKPETPCNLSPPLTRTFWLCTHHVCDHMRCLFYAGKQAWLQSKKALLWGQARLIKQSISELGIQLHQGCCTARHVACTQQPSAQMLTGKRKNSLCSWPLRKKLGRCLMALVLRAVMLLNLPGCSLRRADTLSIT